MLESLSTGWYSLESDGVRDFRWSSNRSVVPLDSTKNTLRLFMGTDRPDIVVRFVYNDGKSYEIPTRIGWSYYCVPYNGQSELVIETEVFTPSNDSRKLGMMV